MIDDEERRLQEFLKKVEKIKEEAKQFENLYFSVNWYYVDLKTINNTVHEFNKKNKVKE